MRHDSELFSDGQVDPGVIKVITEHSTLVRKNAGDKISFNFEDNKILLYVLSGSQKIIQYSENGSDVILDFSGPGSLIGYAELSYKTFSVEFLSATDAYIIPSHIMRSMMQASSSMRNYIMSSMSNRLNHMIDHVACLATFTATQRLAKFLASRRWEGSAPIRHESPIILPMSQRDISTYLGLSRETVTRAFATLNRSSIISMQGYRRIRINDVDRLLHIFQRG
ncbi:Crp/Fnr family transcriptional regulator [Swaminathania salitolerans]|uniref:HTH crp-type domain-containing protein n=1 Tax=Swaminathania salitolerans TaxID=182838 RepID=A0A511BMN7_9PROT|nr:Crp/Fnr family transcriptional regulator [Swaminathania salitolerans]GBQ10016.1 Crp family regulatory protein [Swaminathania salitolerans LMG 21291]GEL01133.1 hypothetical protein SSA02_02960 [Swaminathania salitolerans]